MGKENAGKWVLSPLTFVYWILFAFVGGLFILKYAPRTHLNAFAAGFGYCVFFVLLISVAGWVANKIGKFKNSRRLLFLGLLVYLALALSVYWRMDPNALQVDRWSCLVHFGDLLFHGRFPYVATSHLGHGISWFPVWFLFALPFYLVGDVGLMQFAALFAFAILLVIRFKETRRPIFLLAMLISLPVFEYEVFVRSELFTNMVAVAWLIHLGSKTESARGGRIFLWAVVWGLMLSTRGIVFIPLLLGASQLLSGRNVKTGILFFAIVFATLIATLLPFYLWNPQLFMIHNPYFVQSGYIPTWALALVVLSTCFLALRSYLSPENSRPFLHAGLLLYGTVLLCLILKTIKFGWVQALWGSQFDISYFSLSVPFLLIAWGEFLPAGLPAVKTSESSK